jgi:aminomethyltransferase
MQAASLKVAGFDCHVSRSGYTGEDGFEISVRGDRAERLARALLAEPEALPIGLGARDSLRMEAGLCLYGRDIDESISPVEAGLAWSIGKRRLAEGGFPGVDRIRREIAEGPERRRVGLLPEGRAPARAGVIITKPDETPVGVVTSGGFGPSLNGPLAMGYVVGDNAAVETELMLVVRGTPMPARVAPMPFIPHRYKR